jgi:hypothetical protein
MVKAEKGSLLHTSGRAMGRGRVSTQLIFSHLGVQTWATGLRRQKNWGQGTKVCIVKQSQSHVWFGWSHDWWGQQTWSGRWSSSYHLKGVIWVLFERIILAQDNCPHCDGGSSRWHQFLVIKMYQFCPFWNPTWLQSDCKENGLEQRQIQNGGRDAKLLLCLVNSYAQIRNQCFSAKAV